MLTLFTGAPGAGKTASLVELLMQTDNTRPIFNDGLEGLKLPGRVIHPLDATKWPDSVPDGAIVVVDEAQRVWRPRGPSAAAPKHVTEMETHRHRGLDFFVTTQAPRLVDANIRSLVGRHVHLRDTGFLGRYAYEWPECNENMAWKSCVNKRKFSLPKKAFANYVSASLHTKPIRKLPPALVIAVIVVIGAIVGAVMVVRTLNGKVAEPEKAPVKVSSSLASSSDLAPARGGAAKVIDDRIDWVPRVSSRPESAPAFDEIRKVAVMPVITGCAIFAGKARCYTQQGTDAGLADHEARALFDQPRFNAYEKEKPDQRHSPSPDGKTASAGDSGAALAVFRYEPPPSSVRSILGGKNDG